MTINLVFLISKTQNWIVRILSTLMLRAVGVLNIVLKNIRKGQITQLIDITIPMMIMVGATQAY
jgi:hypothetical protein